MIKKILVKWSTQKKTIDAKNNASLVPNPL